MPVIAKSYVSPTLVLLAFDWPAGAERNDFLGFAIQRTPGFSGGDPSWLPNRIGFNGVVAFDRETYVGRDVAHLFRPGSANPVRYLPLGALLTGPPVPPASVAPTTVATPETFAGEAVEPGVLERVLPRSMLPGYYRIRPFTIFLPLLLIILDQNALNSAFNWAFLHYANAVV